MAALSLGGGADARAGFAITVPGGGGGSETIGGLGAPLAAQLDGNHRLVRGVGLGERDHLGVDEARRPQRLEHVGLRDGLAALGPHDPEDAGVHHARAQELNLAQRVARLGAEEDDRRALGHAPSATLAVRSRSAVRKSESRTSTTATRESAPISSFSKSPLGSLMSRAQRSAMGAPELEPSLLVVGPDDQRAAVDGDVLHPFEGDVEAEISPEYEGFALEQRLAGGRLPADADRALGFQPHRREW